MQWQDPNEALDVNFAAVATGWGSTGDWVVCIPERCTGFFDAVTATLVNMEILDCNSRLCNVNDCPGGCPAAVADPNQAGRGAL